MGVVFKSSRYVVVGNMENHGHYQMERMIREKVLPLVKDPQRRGHLQINPRALFFFFLPQKIKTSKKFVIAVVHSLRVRFVLLFFASSSNRDVP